MKKKHLVSAAQNLIIVLLAAGAVALALRVNLTGSMDLDFSPAHSSEGAQDAEAGISEASRPNKLSVMNSLGRCGVVCDDETADSMYDSLGRCLGEALGSSGEPAALAPDGWMAALESPGAYFEFPAPVPLSVLAAWLGAGSDSELSASDFCVSLGEDGTVSLSFGSGSEFFSCPTAVRADSLLELVEQYSPNGVSFCFELTEQFPSLAGADPFSLIDPNRSLTPASYAVSSPLGVKSQLDSFISSLNFNPYSDSSYTDSSGGRVFMENSATLRIPADGSVSLSVTAAGGDPRLSVAEGASDAEVTEAVRAVLEELLEPLCGDAELYLSSYSGGDGARVVCFDYILDGIPVTLASGHAARAVVEDGRISRLTLRPRCYTENGVSDALLPPLQAAALASGGELSLEYLDSGGETLTVGWKK